MKIIVLNSRDRFRKEDLKRLDEHKAVFYEQRRTKLEDIKELKSGEDVILGVQPGHIEGVWKGLPLEKIQKYKGIKAICLSTTAFGWVPFEELSEMNIIVTNVPGKSTDSVAEYYVFMMIGLLRKLPNIFKNNWEFEYDKDVMGTDAKGLKVGIVGLGRIGTRVAEICSGLDMEVSYWNRTEKNSSYQSKTLEELFKTSDVVFFTITSDKNTKGLISNELIDSMKKTAVILSPIEEGPYDKKYILEKVAKKELGGFGFESRKGEIDKFEGNVFPAPEVGYYTKQTLDNESEIMTNSMISIIEGNPINVVN
ncbi:MAG: hypothetical protein GF368_04600 [Candidatus Aenigmarchaeota archaeon]|nr:hypothetical protein [Candidatus Aenigmarchaeota archaeon]